MGNRIAGGLFALILAGAFAVNASASEIDVLLDKLVEKGVLTPIEAQLIMEETKAQVAEELVKGEGVSAPSWTQKINIKQDVRVRYQYDENVSDAVHRDRARIRYRLGVEGNITQNFKAGAGMATGSTDPRSTNETLDNTFEHPDLRLDYAYGQYKAGNFSAIGGKFVKTDYLWVPTDMLWDTDINPEGASANYNLTLGPDTDWFNNAGFWIIDDTSGSEDDPYLLYYQTGIGQTIDQFDVKLSGTVYEYKGLTGINPDNDGSTNTRSGSNMVYDYDAINISGEIGYNGEGEAPVIPRIALTGDYVQNLDDDVADDKGWSLGGYIGHKKISEKGSWQIKYLYTELEKDAWFDALPDSDRYGGGTDVEGHEFILSYGLAKNVSVDLDFYQFDRIKAASDEEFLAQADLNFKF